MTIQMCSLCNRGYFKWPHYCRSYREEAPLTEKPELITLALEEALKRKLIRQVGKDTYALAD